MTSKTLPPVGIDFHVIGRTPHGERVRIYYSPHDPHPALGEILLKSLGLDEPFIECAGQIVGIFKD